MRILILIILFNVSLCVSGQSGHMPGLEERLRRHTKEDTVRVNLLNQLAYGLAKNDRSLSDGYASQALELAGRLKYDKGKAYSLWIKGVLCSKTEKAQALAYFEQADKIAEAINDLSDRALYLMAIGNMKTTMGYADEGIVFHRKALSLAESVSHKTLIVKCRINIALYDASKGDLPEAAKRFNEIVRDAEEINDSSLLTQTYSNLATINSRAGNYPKGMEYYLKALDIYEKTNNQKASTLCLINIAGIQAEHKDRDAALKTINKALKLAQEHNNAAHTSLSYAVLENLHILSDKPKALEYYRTALSYQCLSASQNITVYMRMGTIYTDMLDFENAELYFQKALQIAESNNYVRQISDVYRRYSSYFLIRKDYKAAIQCAEKAVSMAIKSNSPVSEEEALKQLSLIHEKSGNTREALTLYKNHTAIRDSIFKENNLRKLAIMESEYAFSKEREKYESDKAASEILLKKHKQISWLLIFITLLTIILSAILYHWYKLKKRLYQIEIENMNKELENKQKVMTMAQLKLVKNAERDNQTVNSLEKIIDKADEEGKQDIGRLISNYKYESINSNWKEFETYFIELNSEFYNNLNETYPDLTTNERKLCIFIRLNMSNKDITQITYQSDEALKKSRLRLRRKLNLERNANLSSFIQSI